MHTCKNCDHQFEDSCNFCPNCGQRKDDRLTIRILFENTVSNYFCVDSRFFKSFVPLMVKPGFVPKRFILGKRHTYLHPAQTYLFISVVFFFVFSFVSREQQRQMDNLLENQFNDEEEAPEVNDGLHAEKTGETLAKIGVFTIKNTANDTLASEVEGENTDTDFNLTFLGTDINMDLETIDSLILADAPEAKIYKAMGMPDDASAFEQKVYEQTLKIYKRKGSGVLQSFYDTIPITMFFLLPVFALILKLLYFKKGPFSHHLVFSFYFFSFLFLVFALLMGANLIWNVPGLIDNLVLFSTFFYLVMGTRNFYEQNFIISFFKSGVATSLFFMLVIPFTVAAMFIFAFLFY